MREMCLLKVPQRCCGTSRIATSPHHVNAEVEGNEDEKDEEDAENGDEDDGEEEEQGAEGEEERRWGHVSHLKTGTAN